MKSWQLGLGAGLGAGLVAGAILFKRKQQVPGDDADWIEVGRLSELTLYPLKSGRHLDVDSADCTPVGLATSPTPGLFTLTDRFLVVYRGEDGSAVTGRTFPTLLRLSVAPAGEDTVRLSHPDAPPLVLGLSGLRRRPVPARLSMWRQERLETVDCGDAAAGWVSGVITGQPAPKYRLGCWLGPTHPRSINHHKAFSPGFSGVSNTDGGMYTDLTSHMLMTKSSMDDLNSRLKGQAMSVKRFRPNFLVDNTGKPFEEDSWQWIRIGDEALFKNVKPCDRCSLTVMDPETCQRDPKGEPLKTLKTYRMIENFVGPIMGVHLGLYRKGTVKLGDTVRVILKS